MIESKKLILLVEDDPDHEALTIRALKKSNMANEVRSGCHQTAGDPPGSEIAEAGWFGGAETHPRL